ncbi:hypothetical protein PCE1_002287 [Barthelona sp. PCE]
MLCSLTGVVATHPVATPDGHIFEKDVILSYLKTHSVCPITKKQLKPDQIIDLVEQEPLMVPNTPNLSMSSILNLVHRSYTLLVEENVELRDRVFTLDNETQQLRDEYDAALRVVDRLVQSGNDHEIIVDGAGTDQAFKESIMAVRKAKRRKHKAFKCESTEFEPREISDAEPGRIVAQAETEVAVKVLDDCTFSVDGKTVSSHMRVVAAHNGTVMTANGRFCRFYQKNWSRIVQLPFVIKHALVHPSEEFAVVIGPNTVACIGLDGVTFFLKGYDKTTNRVLLHPDGELLFCFTDDELVVVSLVTLEVCLNHRVSSMAETFTPDGKQLVMVSGTEIRTLSLKDYGEASYRLPTEVNDVCGLATSFTTGEVYYFCDKTLYSLNFANEFGCESQIEVPSAIVDCSVVENGAQRDTVYVNMIDGTYVQVQ